MEEDRCPDCGELLNTDEQSVENDDLAGLFEDLLDDVEESEPKKKVQDPDEKELLKKHFEAAEKAQDMFMAITEAKGFGIETETAEETMHKVRLAIEEKRFNEALSLVEQASDELEKAKVLQTKKMHTVHKAQEAQNLINEAKQLALYTAESETLFTQAKEAMEKKDYDTSLDLIEKVAASLEDAKLYHSVIATAKEVKEKLVEIKGYGLDISKPEALFLKAKPNIESKDYDKALIDLKAAKESASKMILRRQMEQMNLLWEDTSQYAKAEGTFVLDDEDDEEEEEGSPYAQVRKDGEREQKKREKFNKEYERLRADFENYRKNTEDRIQEMKERANMELIGQMLDVADNFDLAFKAYKKDQTQDLENFMTGMRSINKQMVDILKNENVRPIKCMNEEFDPFQHDAVSQTFDQDRPDNSIVEVVKRGYTIKGKVLRPAKVVVNKYPEY